jgi:transcriptional regulator with XRE-family HTH domain
MSHFNYYVILKYKKRKGTINVKITVGEAIKKVRVEKGHRLIDLASKANMDISTISRIENRDRVDLEKVVALAGILGSDEPLKVACQTCPIYSKLYDCECGSTKKLLN